ncbi:hypothetical protein RI054_28g116390 [Pseudoscourfieldia marina]
MSCSRTRGFRPRTGHRPSVTPAIATRSCLGIANGSTSHSEALWYASYTPSSVNADAALTDFDDDTRRETGGPKSGQLPALI